MRLPTRFPALFTAILLLAGCMVGTTGKNFKPALTPAGVEARLRLRNGEIRGELIEVRDSGLVVAPPGDVLYVPFSAIRFARLAQTDLAPVGVPSPGIRDRMRILSRFPNGLPPDQLQRFLAARGQQSLRVYQP